MSASKILFFLCSSFIAGIFLESVIKIPQIALWAFLFVAAALVPIALIPRKCPIGHFAGRYDFAVIGFCGLFLVLGIVRVQITEFNISSDKLSKFNGEGEVTLVGVIVDEPDIRDVSQILKVRISDSNVLITAKRYPEYKYLDKLKITGKLETPTNIETFNYRNYLMKDHIYSVIAFPKVGVVDKEKYTMATYIYEKILFLKQRIRDVIRHNFSPPNSSILEGTILGNNGAMSKDFKDKLNITGLRHIIAVSGTHVVILSAIIMAILLAMGLWRSQAFYVAIVFLSFYVVFTGLSASGVRAGIMGGLYLLAQKLGRQSMGGRVIVIACAVMLLVNPLLLFYDVGFQLSFLAVMGLIYLEPVIKTLFKFIFKDKFKNLLTIFSTTFAAQIFTLPIMVYNFGNMSLVAPITNLLVLPVASLLLAFGFLFCIVASISNILGWVFFIPCWFLLEYFVWVINIFSQPWMAKTISSISWTWLLVSYLVIAVGVSFLRKKFLQKIV